jgi:hypothetical protein
MDHIGQIICDIAVIKPLCNNEAQYAMDRSVAALHELRSNYRDNRDALITMAFWLFHDAYDRVYELHECVDEEDPLFRSMNSILERIEHLVA